jgi:hypothetical protein
MDAETEILNRALVDAHRHSTLHDVEIVSSAICGCFHCGEIYTPAEITDWLDDRIEGKEGRTALCPRCGIDSVIGSASGFPINAAFLEAMRNHWFEVTGGNLTRLEHQ